MNIFRKVVKKFNILKAGKFYIVFSKVKINEIENPIYSFGVDSNKKKALERCKYEAIERYYIVKLDNHKIFHLKGQTSNFINPTKLFSYPFLTRDLRKVNSFVDFKTNKKWDWVIGKNLTNNKKVYLPIDYIFTGLVRNRIAVKKGICISGRSNSSGCAVGRCLMDARKAAFLELIERDHVLVWWFLGLKAKEIVYSSSTIKKYKEIREFINYSKKVGLKYKSIAIELDLGISVFLTVLESEKRPYTVFGMGCNLDPRVGLIKSMKESIFIHSLLYSKKFKISNVNNRNQVKTLADHGMYYASRNRAKVYEKILRNCTRLDLKKLKSRVNFKEVKEFLLEKGNIYEFIYFKSKNFIVVRLLSDYLLPLNSDYSLRSIRSERVINIYKQFRGSSLFTPEKLNPYPHPIN